MSEDLFQIYLKIWFEASKLIQTGMDLHSSPNLAVIWTPDAGTTLFLSVVVFETVGMTNATSKLQFQKHYTQILG